MANRFILKAVALLAIWFGGITLFSGIAYLLSEQVYFSCDTLSSNRYVYRELGAGRLVTFEISSGYFTNGHRVEDLYICPEDSGYRCIIGGLVFAVPRILLFASEQWNFDGHEFILKDKENIYLLGTRLAVYRIELLDRKRNEKIWYYYSPLRGILAFGIQGNEVSRSYIVQSQCGILLEQ